MITPTENPILQPTTLELFADLLQALTLERTESLMARSLGYPSMDRLIEDCTQALRRERAFAAPFNAHGTMAHGKVAAALQYAMRMGEAMLRDAAPSPEYATMDNPEWAGAKMFLDVMQRAAHAHGKGVE